MTTEETLAEIRAAKLAAKAEQVPTSLPVDSYYYRHELRYRCRRATKCRVDMTDRQYHGGGYE